MTDFEMHSIDVQWMTTVATHLGSVETGSIDTGSIETRSIENHSMETRSIDRSIRIRTTDTRSIDVRSVEMHLRTVRATYLEILVDYHLKYLGIGTLLTNQNIRCFARCTAL